MMRMPNFLLLMDTRKLLPVARLSVVILDLNCNLLDFVAFQQLANPLAKDLLIRLWIGLNVEAGDVQVRFQLPAMEICAALDPFYVNDLKIVS
jgi:hypothetical protein